MKISKNQNSTDQGHLYIFNNLCISFKYTLKTHAVIQNTPNLKTAPPFNRFTKELKFKIAESLFLRLALRRNYIFDLNHYLSGRNNVLPEQHALFPELKANSYLPCRLCYINLFPHEDSSVFESPLHVSTLQHSLNFYSHFPSQTKLSPLPKHITTHHIYIYILCQW